MINPPVKRRNRNFTSTGKSERQVPFESFCLSPSSLVSLSAFLQGRGIMCNIIVAVPHERRENCEEFLLTKCHNGKSWAYVCKTSTGWERIRPFSLPLACMRFCFFPHFLHRQRSLSFIPAGVFSSRGSEEDDPQKVEDIKR